MTHRMYRWLAPLLLSLGVLTSFASAHATPSDEGQIKKVVANQLSALQNLDAQRFAANFCAKGHDAALELVQAISSPPSLSEFDGQDADQVRTVVTKVFPQAAKADIDSFVAAVTSKNNAAYQAAWTQLVKSKVKDVTLTVQSVDISGDSATAQIASSVSGPSNVHAVAFVKEDGEWKDCSLAGNQAQGLQGGTLAPIPSPAVEVAQNVYDGIQGALPSQ